MRPTPEIAPAEIARYSAALGGGGGGLAATWPL